MKKNIIKHESALEEYPDILVPAKTKVPEWYKKIMSFSGDKIINLKDNSINETIKKCIPFLESLSVGYMITLPFDLYVKDNNGTPNIIVKNKDHNIRTRGAVADKNLVPTGFYPLEYTWDTNISFSVPKKYSILITHPLNRNDLPFHTLSGIIDGPYINTPHGNFPFYIKNGFEGIISQGTPIMQLIPFQQESWKAKKTKGLTYEGELNGKRSKLLLANWYKKNYWIKKEYE
jgi:hypothetical protein